LNSVSYLRFVGLCWLLSSWILWVRIWLGVWFMNLQKSLKYPVYSLKVTLLCVANSFFHCSRLISVGCCTGLAIAPLYKGTAYDSARSLGG